MDGTIGDGLQIICLDEGYFPLAYMEELKAEGYTVN